MYGVLVLTACVFVCYNGVNGAVARFEPQEKPEKYANEEGCYVPTLGKVLPYEEPYSPQDGTSCIQYTCGKNNDTILFSCGAIHVGDGCVRTPGDKYLPYPECCDNVRCNEIDDINAIPNI